MTGRKTIANAPSGENTSLTGTEKVPVSGSQFTLVSTIAAYIRTLTQTLTGKTINLTSNTLTGTTAQFNTALSDNDFATLAGSEALTNKTLTSPAITTPTITGAIVFPDDTRQTFNPGANAAGLNVGSHAGDPGTPSNGDLWYDSAAGELTARIAGSNVVLGAAGAVADAFKTISVSGQSDVVADSSTDTLTLVAGSNVTITTNAGTDTITFAQTGGGAPTTSEYVTTASDGGLSAEVVIPSLAGSADRAGIGGAGVSYEFDSGISPLTWSAAVDAEDVDSTVPSHLYVSDNGASETLGTYAWSPAGAFDIRCKLLLGFDALATGAGAGLVVGDSAMNNRVLLFFGLDTSLAPDALTISAYSYASSTYTLRGSAVHHSNSTVYLRIVRDGSNNNSFYWSSNGIMWAFIVTQALTYTAAKAGLRVSAGSAVQKIAVDWIRSDV
jgi:hypothetical protein